MTQINIDRFLSQEEINGSLIFIDTETTGFSKEDIILEIAVIKVCNHKIEEQLHYYIDPGEGFNIPVESAKVHGITNDVMNEMRNNYKLMKAGKPYTGQVAYPLNEIWGSVIELMNNKIFVAHNARFDYRFILSTHEKYKEEHPHAEDLNLSRIIDTVAIAKLLIPRGHVTLDALCTKFSVDRSSRSGFHGAMIDTMLLIEVFWKMISQNNNNLMDKKESTPTINGRKIRQRSGIVIKADVSEAEEHSKFMNKIKK